MIKQFPEMFGKNIQKTIPFSNRRRFQRCVHNYLTVSREIKTAKCLSTFSTHKTYRGQLLGHISKRFWFQKSDKKLSERLVREFSRITRCGFSGF